MAYISFQPSDFFNNVLYTGNGGSQSVTGVGFQPDWVWLKQRANDVSNRNHMLFDSSRGVQKALSSNTTDVEDTSSAYLTSYDSDGFTLGASSVLNRNTTSYASWNWKANGGTTESNTDGTITSTVQANTTSGFSIVTYTGTGSAGSVGHGLGVAPKWVLPKSRNATDGWASWHTGLAGSGYIISLQSTSAEFNNGTSSFSDFPSSSVINFGGDYSISGRTYVVYCFAEVKGYSKLGSYIGNGSSDGVFVYTGFRPGFVLGKRIDGAGNQWFMFDSKISPSNAVDTYLYASSNVAESGGTDRVDFLSNGFKWRNTAQAWNGSGNTYIYIAFAEFPLIGSNGQVGNAR